MIKGVSEKEINEQIKKLAVLDQTVQIKASHFTPVKDGKAIPTGELADVEGTPFDFRVAKPIGQDIHADNEQLKFGSGYDHNFALDRTGAAGPARDRHRGRRDMDGGGSAEPAACR